MPTPQNEMTSRVAFADAIAPKFERKYDADRVDIKLSYGLYDIAWIETKRADTDEALMFAQLILTAKPLLDRGTLPPMLLGTFDTKDIAFVRFADVLPVFAINDINWKETPSSPSEKTVAAVRDAVAGKVRLFPATDTAAVREWLNSGTLSVDYIPINASNFVHIFHRWMVQVWPTIALRPELAAKLQAADFYLADIMSDGNHTFVENLKVLLRGDRYRVSEKIDDDLFREIQFRDKAAAHTAFWNSYKRPPRDEFQRLILTRRDLLIEQDIRERKGAFFTPQRWVEKAHEYLARAFGENWAEENTVWDCAAGTGNLLAGLGNKRNVFASDYDAANVRVMKDGNIVFADQAFQFDFLNGSLDEIPEKIRAAAENGSLVILINPPYAEAPNAAETCGTGRAKTGVMDSEICRQMNSAGMGKASRELFVQFLYRIKRDFPKVKLGVFSKLKYVNAQGFVQFREYWTAEFRNGFVVPADTFDNVKGKFPIGFCVWNLDVPTDAQITSIILDVFDENGASAGQKNFWSYDGRHITALNASLGAGFAWISIRGGDFQNVKFTYITNEPHKNGGGWHGFAKERVTTACVMLAVQHCIPATWLNDRDQFLHPLPTWEADEEFQTDCLIFALFHTQNHIDSRKGTNHWIPFTEAQLKSRKAFASDFMARYLGSRPAPSREAADVLAAGLAVWRHYFAQQARSDFNHNAGFYEIKEFFRGRNDKGRLKSTGDDATFELLMEDLAVAYKPLARKLAAKCYEHGFLSILRPDPAARVTGAAQNAAEPTLDLRSTS